MPRRFCIMKDQKDKALFICSRLAFFLFYVQHDCLRCDGMTSRKGKRELLIGVVFL